MAENSCVKRLQKEYRALCKEPVSHVVARPSPNDILEWQFNNKQQQQQLVADHLSSESPQGENSKPESEKVVNTSGADVKKVGTPRDMQRNSKQSFLTWMMLLLVSIFGIVMALPLLPL
ncbi:ubiquitin-conjugating enzyme 34 [Hibiscus trionum]|uniref:Ubiquitin-conjugating enzyme 34 n=1 Tax=Hibiscus trionum TaxID=183268 RepID=A0A9W7HX47_HIBTR|nr:ubiquitin-conjugating enzyme 34 [Hibiscus trionum]